MDALNELLLRGKERIARRLGLVLYVTSAALGGVVALVTVDLGTSMAVALFVAAFGVMCFGFADGIKYAISTEKGV